METKNPDGSWIYFGQGEEGDKDPEKFSGKLLLTGECSVLLFTTRESTAAQVKIKKVMRRHINLRACLEFRAGNFSYQKRVQEPEKGFFFFHTSTCKKHIHCS